MKYLFIFLIVFMVFVLALTLGTHNDQIVSFNYLLARSEFRISTLLAILFAAGFLTGWGVCGLFWLRLRIALANTRRKLNRYQQPSAEAQTPRSSPSELTSVRK